MQTKTIAPLPHDLAHAYALVSAAAVYLRRAGVPDLLGYLVALSRRIHRALPGDAPAEPEGREAVLARGTTIVQEALESWIDAGCQRGEPLEDLIRSVYRTGVETGVDATISDAVREGALREAGAIGAQGTHRHLPPADLHSYTGDPEDGDPETGLRRLDTPAA